MNRIDKMPASPAEAIIEYGDGEFHVIRPGQFVRCGVTGVQIPLEDLRYWSVAKQEAYATREAVLQAMGVRPRAS
jgi:hypothetical protein